MKKIVCGLIFMLALSFGCAGVFGATSISLESAKVDQNVITVSGKITEPSNYQRYTVVVLKYKETGEYTLSDAVYIGQKEKDDVSLNGGNFAFNFNGNVESGEKYLVRIGGSNVSEPSGANLTEGTGGDSGTFILGDVNGDGLILVNDASILMQFILDKDSVSAYITTSDKFFERSNVTGGEELTAETVSNILQKALNPEFKFPTK